MLLPTQQASGTAALTLVQSTLDDIEKRRAEEEEKIKGKKEDKILKARIVPDEAQRTANAKINNHFFGALKHEENPLAALMARFTTVMNVERNSTESDADFAVRLKDALSITDLIAKRGPYDRDPLTIASFGVDIEDVLAAAEGTAEKSNPMAEMLARLAASKGLARGADEAAASFGLRLDEVIVETRKTLPRSVADIERMSGLTDLGITAKEMIEAIANPSGDAAKKISELLEDKAIEDKTSTVEMKKVLQRLEDVADPKTLEELKVEKAEGNKDPTEVEDAETRAELDEDIRSLEAVDKLEDVKDLNDAVKQQNEQAAETGEVAEGGETDVTAIETMQVLAAGAELSKSTEPSDSESNTGDTGSGITPETGIDANGDGQLSDDEQAVLLAGVSPADDSAATDDARKDILAIQVDDNGIYDYLIRQLAA